MHLTPGDESSRGVLFGIGVGCPNLIDLLAGIFLFEVLHKIRDEEVVPCMGVQCRCGWEHEIGKAIA